MKRTREIEITDLVRLKTTTEDILLERGDRIATIEFDEKVDADVYEDVALTLLVDLTFEDIKERKAMGEEPDLEDVDLDDAFFSIDARQYIDPIIDSLKEIVAHVDKAWAGKLTVDEMVALHEDTVYLLAMESLGHGVGTYDETVLTDLMQARGVEVPDLYYVGNLEMALDNQAWEALSAAMAEMEEGCAAHPKSKKKKKKKKKERYAVNPEIVQMIHKFGVEDVLSSLSADLFDDPELAEVQGHVEQALAALQVAKVAKGDQYLTTYEAYKKGDKIMVPHKGMMAQGTVVRYDKGDRHGSPFYVVDVGEYESIKVPVHVVESVKKEAGSQYQVFRYAHQLGGIDETEIIGESPVRSEAIAMGLREAQRILDEGYTHETFYQGDAAWSIWVLDREEPMYPYHIMADTEVGRDLEGKVVGYLVYMDGRISDLIER